MTSDDLLLFLEAEQGVSLYVLLHEKGEYMFYYMSRGEFMLYYMT